MSKWIHTKRSDVEAYLTSSASRQRWLLNITVIAGTCAAALTAAPALGGKSFSDWLTNTFGVSAPAWQILCAAAAVCSVAATIATQLLKSRNLEEHIVRAQGVLARLEMIEVSIASGQLSSKQAASEYKRCIEEAAFIYETTRAGDGGHGG